jgi:hypothetical protein
VIASPKLKYLQELSETFHAVYPLCGQVSYLTIEAEGQEF